jgi:hypothetical protein
MKEWMKLSDDLGVSETDQKFVVSLKYHLRCISKYTDLRYPKYSYYSPTSTLIIQCMPSPIHESITSILMEGFYAAKSSLPGQLSSRINTAVNQDFDDFEGNYAGSSKAPDLAIQFQNDNGEREVKFVLEVGFSKTYDELIRDAKLWLEGNQEVSVVMLVKFEENPSYQCPIDDNKDLEELGFPDMPNVKIGDFVLQREYGPVVYKGFQWVGHISAAFMEVWKRDPSTRSAVKNGNRIVGHP